MTTAADASARTPADTSQALVALNLVIAVLLTRNGAYTLANAVVGERKELRPEASYGSALNFPSIDLSLTFGAASRQIFASGADQHLLFNSDTK